MNFQELEQKLQQIQNELKNDNSIKELCEKIKDMRTVRVATVLKRRALNH